MKLMMFLLALIGVAFAAGCAGRSTVSPGALGASGDGCCVIVCCGEECGDCCGEGCSNCCEGGVCEACGENCTDCCAEACAACCGEAKS